MERQRARGAAYPSTAVTCPGTTAHSHRAPDHRLAILIAHAHRPTRPLDAHRAPRAERLQRIRKARHAHAPACVPHVMHHEP
jgi:hypothetical protein